MENVAVLFNSMSQWLPFSRFFLYTEFFLVYGTITWNLLSCLLLLLSKGIFHVYFETSVGKKMFLSFVGGTTLFFIFCNVAAIMIYLSHLSYEQGDTAFLYIIYYILSVIAFVFLFYYLISFIVRLVRHIRSKKKEGITLE